MRCFYSFLGAMLVGITSLFAQTNYIFTFSANETLDSVQIRNTVSNQTKMLHGPNFAVAVLKVEKQETAIATVGNSEFLRQTANNTVVVNMEKASLVNLTLYSSNGSVVARYVKTANAGLNMFYIGASAGVYVLVATTDNQTASVKLSLTGNSQEGIFEVATEKNNAVLKSDEDDFACSEGDEIEAIGYYNEQEDVQTFVVGENDEIQIAFEFENQPKLIGKSYMAVELQDWTIRYGTDVYYDYDKDIVTEIITSFYKILTYSSEEEAANAYAEQAKSGKDGDETIKDVILDNKEIRIYYEFPETLTYGQALSKCEELAQSSGVCIVDLGIRYNGVYANGELDIDNDGAYILDCFWDFWDDDETGDDDNGEANLDDEFWD